MPKIRRVLQVAENEGATGVQRLQWGRGRWQVREEFTRRQVEWAICPQRLREQTGLSLKARKEAFNRQFGLAASIPRFRRIYREHGVTKRRLFRWDKIL